MSSQAPLGAQPVTQPLQRDPSEASLSLAALSTAAAAHPQHQPTQKSPYSYTRPGKMAASDDTSQESNNTAFADQVFTPTGSQDTVPAPSQNSNDSSQESSLHQLSQLAATQHRIEQDSGVNGPSRKRMADGEVKGPGASPARGGHSRNTSAVSVASNASTIGDLSHDLRTRLTYAMVKLNHGWQSHSIEEVESIASRAGSPVSSHSTLHGRTGSSASPRLALAAKKASSGTPTASSSTSPTTHESFRPDGSNGSRRGGRGSLSPPNGVHAQAGASSSAAPGLAPPAPIQPSRPAAISTMHPRRNSNPRYTPTLLSHSHSASPHTPAQNLHMAHTPNSQMSGNRTPMADPMLFSPHQNVREVREQDAIESLLFMRSPGNSANMKHGYVPAASATTQPLQPAPAGRHALPTSQPRKTLPNQRPQHSQKRVGFETSPASRSDMEVDRDSQTGTPLGAVRRRTNGGGSFMAYSPGSSYHGGHKTQLSLPAGLDSGHTRQRPRLADADIERMLDRVAPSDNDSSDDEEIELPNGRGGTHLVS